jgi:hypothetical protein
MSSNEFEFKPLTREELEDEGHVFYNMQEPDSPYWEWLAQARGILYKKNTEYTVASDGTLTRISDLQDGLNNRVNKLDQLASERPDWMKRTDAMNAERQQRVEELRELRPDLYELRASYIRRGN